ncbi:hypothetical protein [Effusibacillus dendaii]|uniref:DUF2197 domain-containing protein n=1 Tax=Effusibacillus dendaii TaxID=2743772 RepID=A0A7I8D8V4_9BACL|nr:hypothetical protein [Effusibacillus dendaii]BCJ85246.1 hypothetical protein skT53_02310 [Effusibacillus dendaii]
MGDYLLHCSLCGIANAPAETDMNLLQTAKQNQVYICPACEAKVKYESDQKFKP